MVYCDICDRSFKTSSALRQHLEASETQHPTCNRHNRIFASSLALQQHIDDSQSHNVCDICPDDYDSDFPTSDILYNHKVEEHDYCNECQVRFIGSRQLIEHDVSEHNMCETCSRYFATPSNLLNVSISSSPYADSSLHVASQDTCCKKRGVPRLHTILHIRFRHGTAP